MDVLPSRVLLNGNSQAVRIPAEFRLSSDRVQISRTQRPWRRPQSPLPGLGAQHGTQGQRPVEMGKELPAVGLLETHLQTGSRQALGIDREQQHLSGGQIGVEAASSGRYLVR
jgi:hypothetical protein